MVVSVSAVTSNQSQPPSSKFFSSSGISTCSSATSTFFTLMRTPSCLERYSEMVAAPWTSMSSTTRSIRDQRRQ